MQTLIRHIVLLCLVFLAFPAEAQRTVDMADRAFDALDFRAAEQLYQEALDHKKGVRDEAYVFTRMGDCRRLLNETNEAAEYYSRAEAISPLRGDALYHYAQVLRANRKYVKARQKFEALAAQRPGDEALASIIEGLYRVEEMSRPNPACVLESWPLNTEASEFGAYLHNGALHFASNGLDANGMEDRWTQSAYLDIYTLNGDDEKPVNFAGNSRYHDGPAAVDPVTGNYYITRSQSVNRREGGIVHLQLVVLDANGEQAAVFPFADEAYSVGHAAFSPDGSYMYFASDMHHADACGGVDLYRVTRRGNSWAQLENLGTSINTAGDDMFPFVTADNRLIFSSTGRAGLGGLDLFEAIPGDNDTWEHVYNMGAPLNTHFDDFNLVLDGERKGYFASNRPEGKGGDDIYRITDGSVLLIGRVIDAETGKPVTTAGIEWIGGDAGSEKLTDPEGGFHFRVNGGQIYHLAACAPGYFCNSSAPVDLRGRVAGDVVRTEIYLRRDIPMTASVSVRDADTHEFLFGANVTRVNECDGNMVKEITNPGGLVSFTASAGCTYMLEAEADGYYPATTAWTTGFENEQHFIIDLERDAMVDAAGLDEGILFAHIYYDYDKSDLRADAEEELERILSFLKENPQAVLRMESHADSRAPEVYNTWLSEERAQSVRSWFVDRGVDASRLETAYFGEGRTVNECTSYVPCSEEDHQLNRRTEFRIISGLVDIRSLAPFEASAGTNLR